MSIDRRVAWCGRAILELTSLARETYLAGTDEGAGRRRRRFEELRHPIAGRGVEADGFLS